MEASSGEIDSAASGVVRWPVRVETGHYAHPVAPEVEVPRGYRTGSPVGLGIIWKEDGYGKSAELFC